MGNLSDFIVSSETERKAVGEIVEFVGAPVFYSLTNSKWLQTATYTANANLTAAMKLTFQQSASPWNNIALAGSGGLQSSGNFSANNPIARLSGSSISVVPAVVGSTLVAVGSITSGGLQLVYTGQTSLISSTGVAGSNVALMSDNTNLWAYTFTAANVLSAYKSTTGSSWATQALSGLPTFSVTVNAQVWGTGSGVVKDACGDKLNTNATETFLVVNCGAKRLLVASGGTNFIASLSTDGIAFGGDNSVAVLGSSTIPITNQWVYFYKNGNNCYLTIGTNARYSTDGGATWGACTNPPAPSTSGVRWKRNMSDPTRLAYVDVGGGVTAAKFSTNSGQTWTSQTLPSDPLVAGGFATSGAVALMVRSGVLYRSPDDGATWAAVNLPSGALAVPQCVFADANRFYLVLNNVAQVLTSTDGLTWTIRATPAATVQPSGIMSFNSNSVAIIATASDRMLFTNDGGVTWSFGTQDTVARSNENTGDCYTTVDGGGIGFSGIGSNTAQNQYSLFLSDLAMGGAFYRTGATAVTPLRANTNTFQRVA